MYRKIIFMSFLFGCALANMFAFAQEANTYINIGMGFEIQKPDTWKFEEQATTPLTLFIKPPLAQEDGNLYIFGVLVVASVPGMTTADGLQTMREQMWKGFLGDKFRKVNDGAMVIAGENGQSLFFESEDGEKSVKWEEYYIVKDETLYLLQFMAPKTIFENYRKDFEFIFKGFKLIKATEKEKNKSLEEEIALNPSSGRVVFICNVDSASGEYAFLSAISASARLNNGKPVVIATNGKLSESARNFLKRYLPGKAYILGSEHQGIKGTFIEQPCVLWDTAQTVVVSARERTMGVIAAPLAARLGCPLLFEDDKLDSELERLKPEHIVVVGEVNHVKFAAKITVLKDALDVAAFFGKFDYAALTNTYLNEGKPDRSYLLASMLAASHKGVVYPICKKIQFNFGVLTEQIEEEGKKYLQGKIPVGQSEIKVKVPIREVAKELPPHFDDPYLDINDGNGFILTKIGDAKVINGIEYAFSMRMIGALGITKFQEYQRENRVYLLTPSAAVIQKELLYFYAKTSMPKYTAIVGMPESIPFGYQRDPVYFDSVMHEQELATDNVYANIDNDDYLELAVGRIVNPDVYMGSVNLAGIVTYDEIGGDWQKKALFIYPTSSKIEEESHAPMVFSSFESLLKNMEYEMKRSGFDVAGYYRDGATLDTVYPNLQGQALIIFAQHSDELRWSFSASDGMKHLVPRWGNDSENLPPDIRVLPYFDTPTLLIGLGCDSGGLDRGVEPDKAFLYGCFEKGAIGYIGNTRAGFPDTEEHAIKKMINDILYQGSTVGEAFRNGKNYLLYIFRNRKPYRIDIFKDYSLAYEREFYQLVYYGDPALKMKVPKTSTAVMIKEQKEPNFALLTIQPSTEIWQYEVMNMKVVGKGPVEYLKEVNSPGLSYSSTDWGDPNAASNLPRILPSVFVKYELPKNYSELNVLLEDGPEWCYRGYNVETLEDGKTYLLSNIAIIKYLPCDGKYEVANKVVLRIAWR